MTLNPGSLVTQKQTSSVPIKSRRDRPAPTELERQKEEKEKKKSHLHNQKLLFGQEKQLLTCGLYNARLGINSELRQPRVAHMINAVCDLRVDTQVVIRGFNLRTNIERYK